ncbi:alpha/beta hydrolase [Jatrophihabitans sp.]|uniref:alpha/beta hydrolase family protein n=1 Tax=Jatrophihabitans sp. TaxID=1932789 RepID=UPI0030C68060|nr:hypothetical protein [Jatrophihabitans sp.]
MRDSATAAVRHAYGTDDSQFGELSLPAGASLGTVVIVHGGFWLSAYGLELGRPLAADLVVRGYTVWNLEYRRVGDGGGWPTTLQDVAAGIDHLAVLAPQYPGIDLRQVVGIGHSAGGQLAVWAAGRPGIPDGAIGSAPAVRLASVVSQAGVLDLTTAANTGLGGTAVQDLLGGSPAEVPARYKLADPIEAVPLDATVLCVHARGDMHVPYAQSVSYVTADTRAGGRASLREVPGDHFTLIDPSSEAWSVVVEALPGLLS